jgi:hypothetical protein
LNHNQNPIMKICLIILTLAAIVVTGCQSDKSDDNQHFFLQKYPADVAPPPTNMPPMNASPPP